MKIDKRKYPWLRICLVASTPPNIQDVKRFSEPLFHLIAKWTKTPQERIRVLEMVVTLFREREEELARSAAWHAKYEAETEERELIEQAEAAMES